MIKTQTAEAHLPTETESPPFGQDPGALRGEAWLIVQTRQAQRLIKGRRAGQGKPAIIGLLGFADRMRSIWTGARADDPYADWWLWRVHQALGQAETILKDEQAAMAARLQALSGIEISPAVSQEPTRVPLRFGNPYAFRGARLLGVFDELARSLLTARHVGLVEPPETERLLSLAARPVRRTFTSPQGYRFLGVTRADLTQGNARAERARQVMGELPQDILNGSQRAPLAPASPRPSEAHADSQT